MTGGTSGPCRRSPPVISDPDFVSLRPLLTAPRRAARRPPGPLLCRDREAAINRPITTPTGPACSTARVTRVLPVPSSSSRCPSGGADARAGDHPGERPTRLELCHHVLGWGNPGLLQPDPRPDGERPVVQASNRGHRRRPLWPQLDLAQHPPRPT